MYHTALAVLFLVEMALMTSAMRVKLRPSFAKDLVKEHDEAMERVQVESAIHSFIILISAAGFALTLVLVVWMYAVTSWEFFDRGSVTWGILGLMLLMVRLILGLMHLATVLQSMGEGRLRLMDNDRINRYPLLVYNLTTLIYIGVAFLRIFEPFGW